VKEYEMKVTAINKQGKIIASLESSESRNIATNEAIDLALKVCGFFAIYVDGKLDCYSESSDRFAFPKTI
jgi:hypothetical protein